MELNQLQHVMQEIMQQRVLQREMQREVPMLMVQQLRLILLLTKRVNTVAQP